MRTLYVEPIIGKLGHCNKFAAQKHVLEIERMAKLVKERHIAIS